MPRIPLLLAIGGVLVFAAGCRLAALDAGVSLARATAPAAARPSSFYPLAIGNRWLYSRDAAIHLDGTPVYVYHASTEHELVCAYVFDGRDYTIEAWREVPDTGVEVGGFVHDRQDARGLYERDVVAGTPVPAPCGDLRLHSPAATLTTRPEDGEPATGAAARTRDELLRRAAFLRAAIGWPGTVATTGARPHPAPAAGEITRLAYPLAIGQSWVIRGEPRFTCRVEAVEPLRLAYGTVQAYRLRITSELFGPDIDVRTWYGRDGFLALEFHDRLAITDESGNIVGVGTYDERQVLDAFEAAGTD